MKKLDIKEKLEKVSRNEDEVLPYEYEITSYGVDYTVDGLVKRMKECAIYIPSFQRSYVWDIKEASRFIESLLLGLPVPGIFFSKESDTQKLLVVDGQQRLKTLQYFYEGRFDKKDTFNLVEVQKEFEGKSYKTLPEKSRRRLDDSIIHATVIRQDVPSEDESSIYFIFERLNTGGKILQPQEIRSCIYHGEFNDLLRELNENKDWRFLYGTKNKRMKDEEIILRFLALFYEQKKYQKPMKGFLNSFMGRNKNLKNPSLSRGHLTKLFSETVKTIHKSIGESAFKPKGRFMVALAESVMVGIAKKIERGGIKEINKIKPLYNKLIKNKNFQEAITTHTSDEEKVNFRINSAINVFSKI